MSAPAAEQQTPIEYQEQQISGERALQWLTCVGNDERKLVTVLALDHANKPLGKSGLYHYLGELMGVPNPIGDLNTPFQFCEQSIATVQAVEETTTEVMRFGKIPEVAPAFEITHSPEYREFAVAFAGSLLTWSKRHPGLSLNLLGQSASRNDNTAPLVRFWVLYDLATSGDTPKSPSIANLAHHLTLTHTTRGNTVRRLKQLGLTASENLFQENRRQFRIIQPKYITGPSKRPFERLVPESQMLFSAFSKAFEEKQIWELDSFMALVADMYPEASPELLKKARTRMHQVFVPGSYQYKGVVESYGERQYDAYSKVELLPEVAAAIQELVAIIDGFYSGSQMLIDKGKIQAADILSDPVSLAELYQKAYDASNIANSDNNFSKHILDIIGRASEGVTSGTIRDLYAEQVGRKVSSRTIQGLLRSLVAAGTIEFQVSPTSRTNRQPTRRYKRISQDI